MKEHEEIIIRHVHCKKQNKTMEIINISRLVTRYKSNKKNRNECVAVSITVWLQMLHNILL